MYKLFSAWPCLSLFRRAEMQSSWQFPFGLVSVSCRELFPQTCSSLISEILQWSFPSSFPLRLRSFQSPHQKRRFSPRGTRSGATMWDAHFLRRWTLCQLWLLRGVSHQVFISLWIRPVIIVTLVCLPDLTYAWVFNEYPYFVQQDNRRFVSQQTGNLYIAKVEPSDVGNYTCVVMNSITKGKVHSSPTALILRTDGKTVAYGHDVTSMPFNHVLNTFHFKVAFIIMYYLSRCASLWLTHQVLLPVSE